MSDIVPFGYGDKPIRIAWIDGEPWFVLKDICDALGIGNPSDVARRVPDGEKQQVTLNLDQVEGGNRPVWVVSEPGMYRVVLRSDKPAAEPFMHFVVHDVLPELRETGMYIAPATRQALPSADKPLELKLAQYQAKLDRELMRKGLYRNMMTGQIEPLPGTVQDKDIDRKLDEHIARKTRRANRSADSPYQTRDEQRRSAPWEDNLGDQ